MRGQHAHAYLPQRSPRTLNLQRRINTLYFTMLNKFSDFKRVRTRLLALRKSPKGYDARLKANYFASFIKDSTFVSKFGFLLYL